jgi:ElaB/YqjD/DUF883 family membrane-anchored ribosome-binding protein
MANGELIVFPGQKSKLNEQMIIGNIEEQLAKIESFVLDNPVKSLAIALATGMLLGLLGRRS